MNNDKDDNNFNNGVNDNNNPLDNENHVRHFNNARDTVFILGESIVKNVICQKNCETGNLLKLDC